MPTSISPAPTVHFGEPMHGWLPVSFQVDTFCLAFHASAVPINPLEALCEVLAVVAAGGNAKVLWHLEPAEYWFTFEHRAETIVLTIMERANRSQSQVCILELAGTVETLLLPFYKALKEFAAHKFSAPQWPALDKFRLERLAPLLQS